MADFLEEIVQKITTRCDISGFTELSIAIEESTKQAQKLSRALSRAITPEQKIAIENAKMAQRQYAFELERERNAYSNNRLEALKLTLEKQRNANATRLQYQETARFLAQKRLETQLSRENVMQMRRELSEQRRLNFEKRGSGFWGGVGRRVMAFAGAYIGIHTLRNIIDTGSRLNLIKASIEGLTKSTQDWQFIQEQAWKNATKIEVVAKGYRNFYSAAKMAGFDKDNIQGMYSDLLLSTRAIGASTQQTEGALLALEQMISKGTVSMEELRRQLGNALPGAFEIGAKAMNMTTMEFNKFVRTGKLASAEFVPLFIKTLKEEYASGFADIEKTLNFAQGRLTVAWEKFTQEFISGEAGKSLAQGLMVLADLLVSPEFQQFVTYLGYVFSWIIKIFSWTIKNLKLVLILLGVRGFYGLLVRNRTLFRLLTMDIGKAFRALIMLGKAGKLGFGAMSLAAQAFMKTLARVIAPLLLIEDLIFFIGEAFLGWNTKSAIGSMVALANRKIGKENLAKNILPDEIEKMKKTDPKFKNALESGDWKTVRSYFEPELYGSFAPQKAQGMTYEKDESQTVHVHIGNINLGDMSGNMQMGDLSGYQIGRGLGDVIIETGIISGATPHLIGNTSYAVNNPKTMLGSK